MKNIFVLIAFLSLAVAGYSQSSTGGIFLRVNDSTTYRSSASTAALHTAGYHDIVYNNQATTPHYDVYFGPGTNDYYHVNSLGWAPTTAGGGATAAGAVGNVQYKSNGGGLQAEAAFSYDSATNILDADIITVDTEAYDATGWNGDLSVPTKDAVRDKIETMGSVVGAQDLFLSSAAMWPRSTNPCADLTRTEVATSLFNIQTLDFDQTTQEYAQVQVVLPRNWNNGTITATPYWTAGSGTGGVVWSISGGAYSNDDALSVAFGTAQTSTDTFIAANDVHIGPTTSAITLAGTPADADFIALQITRVVGDGSDTLNADAKLLGIRITLTLDASTSE